MDIVYDLGVLLPAGTQTVLTFKTGNIEKLKFLQFTVSGGNTSIINGPLLSGNTYTFTFPNEINNL